MKKNVGSIDAVIRTDLAFVLAYIFFNSSHQTGWYLVGILFAGHFLATAIFGIDPLYRILGISTNKGVSKCGECGTDKNCVC